MDIKYKYQASNCYIGPTSEFARILSYEIHKVQFSVNRKMTENFIKFIATLELIMNNL